jgi:positive regulator of sigma E activity
MFPILALIAGALLGQRLGSVLAINVDLASFGFGAFLFGFAFFLVRIKDKKLGQTGQTTPKVAQIIKEG